MNKICFFIEHESIYAEILCPAGGYFSILVLTWHFFQLAKWPDLWCSEASFLRSWTSTGPCWSQPFSSQPALSWATGTCCSPKTTERCTTKLRTLQWPLRLLPLSQNHLTTDLFEVNQMNQNKFHIFWTDENIKLETTQKIFTQDW